MKLLIVSEGKHEQSGALETLVRRLGQIVADFAFRKVSDAAFRGQHGTGPRYTKRAVRCLLYAEENGYDGLVLLIDQDDQVQRRQQISKAQEDLRTSLPRAMGVAVLTFDAWMLADERALTTVLDRQIQRQPDPERIPDPKSTCAALRDEGDSDVGLAVLYARLAEVIDLDLLASRCPVGFGPFAQRVRQLAEQVPK